MSLGQRRFRVVLYLLWGVLMTGLTFVLGALPLKSLRRGAGRTTYWGACLFAAVLLFGFHLQFYSVSFLSLVVLVGLFSEFEELGLALVPSAFFALLITAMLSASGFAFWVFSEGPNWQQSVMNFLHAALDPILQMNSNIKIEVRDIMAQLPSLAIIMWMVSLYLAVLLETRLTAPSAQPLPKARFRKELPNIRIPDVVVWTFIAALLGAFGTFKGLELGPLHSVSVNAFNVCLVVFFFQGLAVVRKFFDSVKMGWFWQSLLMVFIVLQLFIFVSLLGLVDHWVDFRTRIERRRQQIKREI
jgi:hypothetical protein